MSGTYTISLTVSNSQGSNTSPKTNVTVSPAPTVNFSASTVKGCFPVSTNFNDMSSTSTGNNIVLWNWTFGDGGASTACNPSHTYTGLGILLKDTSAIQYNWDFGNGQSSSMANPSAINYLVGGNFVVKLHTSSANGCTADTSQKVLVNSVPNLFAGNDTTVCFGTKVALHASGANAYKWLPPTNNQLSCISCANPIATLASAINIYVVQDST